MQKQTPKVSLKKLSRGIRNCNPGNIRHSSDKWLGMCSHQTDSSFVQFDTMAYGVRALLILLRNYYVKHHLTTIREIISRYAPQNENHTNTYIDYVAEVLDYSADTPLNDLDFRSTGIYHQMSVCSHLYLLAKAICYYESRFYLEFSDYTQGLELAL